MAFPQPRNHLYEVSLAIGNVTTPQLDLSLPIWTPGSYLAREYAHHVQDSTPTTGRSVTLPGGLVDKATWRIETGAGDDNQKTVRVNYRVYAIDWQRKPPPGRDSRLFQRRFAVHVRSGRDGPPASGQIHREGWRVTTPLALQPDPDGYYTAADYDRLIDSPTEIGAHKLLEFAVRGKPHRVAIWGQYEFDDNRLMNDLAKIVEEGAKMFGSLPRSLHLHHSITARHRRRHGASELQRQHDAARSLQIRARLQRLSGPGVARILPSLERQANPPFCAGPFDYQRENYTRGLWVSEERHLLLRRPVAAPRRTDRRERVPGRAWPTRSRLTNRRLEGSNNRPVGQLRRLDQALPARRKFRSTRRCPITRRASCSD